MLLIDLDPQAHLSLHYGMELTPDQASVYDVLTASLPIREATVHAVDGVHLLPSDIDLAGAEAELVSVPGREVILREAIDACQDPIDVLLIDCPPSLGTLTINALVAVDELLIPLQAQFFALQGLGKLLNTVTLVKRRINPSLRVTGVVLCMHEPATRLAGEVVEDLDSFLTNARGTEVPWPTPGFMPRPSGGTSSWRRRRASDRPSSTTRREATVPSTTRPSPPRFFPRLTTGTSKAWTGAPPSTAHVAC